MKITEFLEAIDVPKSSCEYWDVRIEDMHKTELRYEDYELVACDQKPSCGAFIRVFENGLWYYMATTDLKSLSEKIVELSRQAKETCLRQTTTNIKPYNARAAESALIRFDEQRLDKVDVGQKRILCESYFQTLQSFPEIQLAVCSYADEYKVKAFRSSEGVRFVYDFNQCGLHFKYTVQDEHGDFQDFLTFYGSDIQALQGQQIQLQQAIQESLLFTKASDVPSGHYPVVLESGVVGVFAHESFGHKSEADFMLGDEDAKKVWQIGKRVGSDCLSIIDSGVKPGTSGYCPFDDEGFPTQKTHLIKNGILTGRLHSQETAQVLDEPPTGNGRSIGFEFEPIVRMTNTYVEAGEKSFEEMISEIDFGIYCKDYLHGSGLSTFTIAPRKSYMIRDGEIAEPVRVAVLSGSVFETLRSVTACSKEFELENQAFGGCGKIDQWPLSVGFGGPQIVVNPMKVN